MRSSTQVVNVAGAVLYETGSVLPLPTLQSGQMPVFILFAQPNARLERRPTGNNLTKSQKAYAVGRPLRAFDTY